MLCCFKLHHLKPTIDQLETMALKESIFKKHKIKCRRNWALGEKKSWMRCRDLWLLLCFCVFYFSKLRVSLLLATQLKVTQSDLWSSLPWILRQLPCQANLLQHFWETVRYWQGSRNNQSLEENWPFPSPPKTSVLKRVVLGSDEWKTHLLFPNKRFLAGL